MNKTRCEPLHVSANITDTGTLYDWLQSKAKDYKLKYSLAHADDGVIWGEFRGQNFQLITSGDVFPQFPQLRLCTLQQCRAFSENAELMLWKVGEHWKVRLINDNNGSECLSPDEHQVLWGTQKEEEKKGFTLVSDGSQGLKHAVPLTNIPFSEDKNNLYRPIRLVVHHYIQYDDSGVARIYLSRLVDLQGN